MYGEEADKASLALRIKMDLKDGINKVIIPQDEFDDAIKSLAEWGYKAEIMPSSPEAEKVSHNENTFTSAEITDNKPAETPVRNTRFTVDAVSNLIYPHLQLFPLTYMPQYHFVAVSDEVSSDQCNQVPIYREKPELHFHRYQNRQSTSLL